MKFSAIYKPTTLFSLRDSNSTSSGGKSLFLPSPYSIRMAFISQSISLGGVDFEENKDLFDIIKNVKISYFIKGTFCVNNCFVKIQKQRENEPFKSTIGFREYIYIDNEIEIIFETNNEKETNFLKTYLHTINYFGKRGCLFQFIKYNDNPSEANVKVLDEKIFNYYGILQEFDDFHTSVKFSNINTYSQEKTKRIKNIYVIPLSHIRSSKSYSLYKTLNY